LNSQQDQIQALLADIDEVLSKPSPRLPWMASVETIHQRQVLDRIRSYLSQQKATQVVNENLTHSDVAEEAGLEQGDRQVPDLRDRQPTTPPPTDSDIRSTAGQILQAVIGEMNSLRTNLTQPLQDDIQALRQERQALTSEIKQLEQRRQDQYSLAQQQANQQQIISEFLQVLMARLQESLARDVAQALSNLEAQFLQNNLLGTESAPQLTSASATGDANAGELPLLTPAQRIEQIRLLQAQSDRDLMRLDSTLTIVFEALQRNLQTYQESLSQGLEKMHSLGQQGEAMFAALVNHLAEQLGREASSYVQSSIPVANIETATRPVAPTAPISTLNQNEVALQEELVVRSRPEPTPRTERDLGEIGEREKLPYPGTELSPQFAQLRHNREELRHSGTQEHSPIPPEDDFLSLESSSSETPSEAMMTEESGELEDLYDSLFTPVVEVSKQPEKGSGRKGEVSTVSLFESTEVSDRNIVPEQIAESTLADVDSEDSLEDFLLESANGEPEPSPESTLTNTESEDYLEDFLLESANVEPEPSPESTLTNTESEDYLEDFLLESPNVEPEPSPESTVTNTESEDYLEDFLLESANVESEQIPESTLTNTESEDYLEDFLLETPNMEPEQIPEPITNTESEDVLEDFLVAEDSEFVAGNFVDRPAIADADLFGETLLELDPEPPAPAAPSPPDSPASRETLADLSNVFGDENENVPVKGQPPSTVSKTSSKELRKPKNLTPVASSSEESTEYDALAEWDADIYVQASPDENLLPVEPPDEEQEQGILLDRNSLERLQADLFSLEGMDSALPEEASSIASPEPFTFSDFSQVEAENPFIVSAEEEMTTLDDLFTEVFDMPVTAAPHAVEVETAAPEFSQGDSSNMTLEDILSSLMEAEATPLNYPPRPDLNSRQVQTTGQVKRSLETPGGEKKKVGLFDLGDGGDGEEWGEGGDGGDGGDGEVKSSLPSPSPPSFPIFPIPLPQSSTPRNSNWYLGIDFGTTMLSAALLNRDSKEVYPLYWEVDGQNPKSECFRIPAVVSLLAGKVVVKSVGQPGLPLEEGGLLLQNFKHYLKLGIPYVSSALQDGNTEGEGGFLFEPMLQWSQQEDVSLAWLLHGLGALLGGLNPARENVLGLQLHAVGLEPSILDAALRQLGGVILGTPAGWGDAYRHNLREAVLGAGLVTESSQIFVVEDAIATLLSELTPNLGEAESKIHNLNSKIAPGGTLIINSGAITTELALVDLPENLENLTYSHFTCQSFAYGGNAIDQDIICQLLLKDESFGPLTQLPRGGYADVAARCQLQGRLQSSPLGLELLAAAANLKVILQDQDRFNLEIGDRRWEVKRRDLETKVLVPFVQQLNREVNAMLSQAGMSPVGINQAICTGGNASWSAIARWLRQKLPNAIVIHDRPANLPSVSPSPKSKIGRVAWGLATLPLYPQVLDGPRQQYSDYFLLWELMQAFTVTPLSISEITQALERRGLNTRTCLPRILPILEGQLPLGLLPSKEDALLLSSASRENPELAMMGAAPLFEQVGNRQYRLNQEQAKYVREYVGRLMASSQQKLEEPLSQSLIGL
jgi:hypothetical protein